MDREIASSRWIRQLSVADSAQITVPRSHRIMHTHERRRTESCDEAAVKHSGYTRAQHTLVERVGRPRPSPSRQACVVQKCTAALHVQND
eukprot:6197994-Pleurochrysis_carterae.AAC.2